MSPILGQGGSCRVSETVRESGGETTGRATRGRNHDPAPWPVVGRRRAPPKMAGGAKMPDPPPPPPPLLLFLLFLLLHVGSTAARRIRGGSRGSQLSQRRGVEEEKRRRRGRRRRRQQEEARDAHNCLRAATLQLSRSFPPLPRTFPALADDTRTFLPLFPPNTSPPTLYSTLAGSQTR